MDVDLPKGSRARIDEPMWLIGVDDRHLARAHFSARLPIVKGRDSFHHDQDLDIRVAVQLRPITRRCIDEQHTGTDTAVIFTNEVARDDIPRQRIRAQVSDAHEGSMLKEALQELRLLHQVARRQVFPQHALVCALSQRRGALRILQQRDHR